MTTRALLIAAAFGLAAPAFAAGHMEKKDAAAAEPKHEAMDHSKMDTTKMSKEDKAAHDKMMKDAGHKDTTAADKTATPK